MNVFEKKLNFNENQIESYFNQNKDTYKKFTNQLNLSN